MTQRPTLIVSAEADGDIDDAAIYLAERSPDSALRFMSSVSGAFELLCENPRAGQLRDRYRTSQIEVRQWGLHQFPNYIFIYGIHGNTLTIYRVLHGARDIDAIMRHEPISEP